MTSQKNTHPNTFKIGQILLLLKYEVSFYAIAHRSGRVYNTIPERCGPIIQIKEKKVKIYYPYTSQDLYMETRKSCSDKYKLLACEAFIGHFEHLFDGKKFSLNSIVEETKQMVNLLPTKWFALKYFTITLTQGCWIFQILIYP